MFWFYDTGSDAGAAGGRTWSGSGWQLADEVLPKPRVLHPCAKAILPWAAALEAPHEPVKLLVDLRSLVEQQLRHDTVPSRGGYHQRSRTVVPLGIDVSPPVEQQPHHLDIAILDGLKQRGRTIVCLGIDVGSSVEQRLHQLREMVWEAIIRGVTPSSLLASAWLRCRAAPALHRCGLSSKPASARSHLNPVSHVTPSGCSYLSTPGSQVQTGGAETNDDLLSGREQPSACDLPSSHAARKHSAPADPPDGYRHFFGEL